MYFYIIDHLTKFQLSFILRSVCNSIRRHGRLSTGIVRNDSHKVMMHDAELSLGLEIQSITSIIH